MPFWSFSSGRGGGYDRTIGCGLGVVAVPIRFAASRIGHHRRPDPGVARNHERDLLLVHKLGLVGAGARVLLGRAR